MVFPEKTADLVPLFFYRVSGRIRVLYKVVYYEGV